MRKNCSVLFNLNNCVSIYLFRQGWDIPKQISVSICCKNVYTRKKPNIRNQYNQVPHLTQDTTWESDKNARKHHIQESQEVSSFPACNHKAEINGQDIMTDTKHILYIYNKKDPQKKHRLVLERSVNILFTGWLKPHPYFLCGSRLIDIWFR